MTNLNLSFIKHFLIIYLFVLGIGSVFYLINYIFSSNTVTKNAKIYTLYDIIFAALISLILQKINFDFEISRKLGFHSFTVLFVISNIIILLYFFVRLKLPGKAWELILTNKHSRNLDTFMVVIGLVFASAFGAITSFEIDGYYLQTGFGRTSIFFIYATTNIVIMTILVFLMTYVINTMGNRKPIMFILVTAIGISLLAQETLAIDKAYHYDIEKDLKKNVIKFKT